MIKRHFEVFQTVLKSESDEATSLAIVARDDFQRVECLRGKAFSDVATRRKLSGESHFICWGCHLA